MYLVNNSIDTGIEMKYIAENSGIPK